MEHNMERLLAGDRHIEAQEFLAGFDPMLKSGNPVIGYLEDQLSLRHELEQAHSAEKRLEIFRKVLQ